MGFSIKIGNPIKSVTQAVTSAVKTVTNTVEDAAKSVERSDVGKIVKTAVQPISTTNEIRKDLFRGKFESAGTRAIGQAGNFNVFTKALDYSSTLKGAASRDNFFGSFAQGSDAFNKLQSGQSLTAEESKAVGDMYVKQAAIAGAAYGGVVYGPAALSSVGSFAAKNSALTALTASQLLKGSRTGDYSQAIQTIGNQIAPGVGDVGRGLLTPRQPATSTPSAGFFDTGAAPSTTIAGAQASSKTIFYAIGAVGLILILAIFKKMRS